MFKTNIPCCIVPQLLKYKHLSYVFVALFNFINNQKKRKSYSDLQTGSATCPEEQAEEQVLPLKKNVFMVYCVSINTSVKECLLL